MGIGVTGPEGPKPKSETPSSRIESFESVDTADEIRQLLEDAETIEAYIQVIKDLCRFFEERYNLQNEKQFEQDNPEMIPPHYKAFEEFDRWYESELHGMHNKAQIALSLYAIVERLESMRPESVQQELATAKQRFEEAEARGVSNLTIKDYAIGIMRKQDYIIEGMILGINTEKTGEQNYTIFSFNDIPQSVREGIETQLQFHNDLIEPQEFPRFFIDIEKRGKEETILRVYDLKKPNQVQTFVLNEPIDYDNKELGQRVKKFVLDALQYFKSLPANPSEKKEGEQQSIKIDLVEGSSSLDELLSEPTIQNTRLVFKFEGTPEGAIHNISLYSHPQNQKFAEKIEGKRLQLAGSIKSISFFTEHIRGEGAPFTEIIIDRYGNSIVIDRWGVLNSDSMPNEPIAFKDTKTRVIIYCPTPYVDEPRDVTTQEFKIDLSALHERGIIGTDGELIFNVLPSAPVEHKGGIAVHIENPENYPKVRDEAHRFIVGAQEVEAWFKAPGSIERIDILVSDSPLDYEAYFQKTNKGTLYVEEMFFFTDILDSRSTGRHEALHVIDERYKISERPEFKAVYEKYKDWAGMVAEYNFEQSAGGHPQDNAGEYFASFINSLMCCDDPEESIQKFTRIHLGEDLDRPDIHMLKETAQVILRRIEEIKKETENPEPWPIEEQLKALLEFIESRLPPSAPKSPSP